MITSGAVGTELQQPIELTVGFCWENCSFNHMDCVGGERGGGESKVGGGRAEGQEEVKDAWENA